MSGTDVSRTSGLCHWTVSRYCSICLQSTQINQRTRKPYPIHNLLKEVEMLGLEPRTSCTLSSTPPKLVGRCSEHGEHRRHLRS